MTKEERIQGLVRNGITPDDLKENWDKGYDAGFKAAGNPVVRTIYAAVCLALNDTHGFGGKRCLDVLKRVEFHVMNELTDLEAVQAVYDRMGLELDFKEPFERVRFKG